MTACPLAFSEVSVKERGPEKGHDLSSENVKELSRLPDDITWDDSIGFSALAPGAELVSDHEIIVEEDGSSMTLIISWGS